MGTPIASSTLTPFTASLGAVAAGGLNQLDFKEEPKDQQRIHYRPASPF